MPDKEIKKHSNQFEYEDFEDNYLLSFENEMLRRAKDNFFEKISSLKKLY